MIVGAGTVINKEQVDLAVAANAQFIVSPGVNTEIIKYCKEKNILIIPGVSNASDIEAAISCGIEVVKFFPSELSGGIKMINALSASYNKIKFIPTGGINENNMNSYLENPKILACGGSWMVNKQIIKAKEFTKIKEICKKTVSKMLCMKIKHIGINAETEGRSVAEEFASLLQSDISETPKGYFAGSLIEIMNPGNHKGTKGHIALGVSSSSRAKRYFESLGYKFDETTTTYDVNGYVNFVYFKDEFAGFGVHLVNN